MTLGVTATREFCYRWICSRCYEVNRKPDHSVSCGDVVECDGCRAIHRVEVICYDNGAVCKISEIPKQGRAGER